MAGGRALSAPAKAPGRDEKLRLAAEVSRIFEAKCADCHGGHLPKPKGKFGYVLDLKRVAANPDYVVRGNPEKSELYVMVRNEEMPGEDTDVPPLTADEKKTVEAWVLAGAPHELPSGFAPGTVPAEKKTELHLSFIRRFMNWLGKFHPVSTHFPVALLTAAVLAEALAWWLKRDEWMLLVRFLARSAEQCADGGTRVACGFSDPDRHRTRDRVQVSPNPRDGDMRMGARVRTARYHLRVRGRLRGAATFPRGIAARGVSHHDRRVSRRGAERGRARPLQVLSGATPES
jgi:hypothetical protein